MVLNLKDVFDNLNSLENEEMYKYNDLIIKYINNYMNSNNHEQDVIRSTFNINDFLKLLSLSDWYTEEALNKNDKKYLKYSLVLHSIEDFRFDLRDNILRLVAIWNVAERIGLDSKTLFKESIPFFQDSSKNHVLDFINRPKSLKTMKSMCLEYVENNDRISIKLMPPSW